MKKKKFLPLVLLSILMIGLLGCSQKGTGPKVLKEEGLAPYDLSEGERYILESFGMENTSQILSFKAPKEATSLSINAYRLEDDRSWSTLGGGAVLLGEERDPEERLAGTFTMQLKENFEIEFIINSGGKMSFKSEEIFLDSEIVAFGWNYLEEFEKIEINKEIPVALMVYDKGDRMRSYSLEDYFNPSEFEKMDLIQAVTLSFSDKEF